MKRYIRSTTLTDILNDPEGHQIVEDIEEAEEEIRGRGLDINDDSEVWVNSLKYNIQKLKDKFGYDWR